MGKEIDKCKQRIAKAEKELELRKRESTLKINLRLKHWKEQMFVHFYLNTLTKS